MSQILQILGALIILVAYTASQFGRMDVKSLPYLWLNLAGSVLLGVLAALGRQWGFLLLEVAWTLVSLWGLLPPNRPQASPPGGA